MYKKNQIISNVNKYHYLFMKVEKKTTPLGCNDVICEKFKLGRYLKFLQIMSFRLGYRLEELSS